MIVYLARDIPQFVMYCVNGKPRSSLFIESTDSMIIYKYRENSDNSTDKGARSARQLASSVKTHVIAYRYCSVGIFVFKPLTGTSADQLPHRKRRPLATA